MKLINTKTNKYPSTIDDLAAEYPNTAFPLNLTPESVIGTIFAAVTEVVPPALAAGESLIELSPAVANGRYTQRWQVAPSSASSTTLAQAVDAMSAAIDLKRDALIATGKPHDFPDGKRGTVQLRNDRDRANVNAVTTAGTVLMLAGDTTSTVAFRDDENVTHKMTGAQAGKFGVDVLAWISQRYDSAWTHKDALAALAAKQGATTAQIMAYDYTSGWAT